MTRLIVLLFLCATAHAQPTPEPTILTLRQQGELEDAWLKERATTVLPDLMRRAGVDMWLLISREYNEDPVLETMLPSTWMGARRTTMLVIYDPGDGQPLETLACARYDVGDVFKKAWDPEAEPDQWRALTKLIEERNPQKIAVNRSETFGLADGITAYHYDQLQAYLPTELADRVVSGEELAIGWLETRIPAELDTYQHIMSVAHYIIAEAFSNRVVTPGVTTTEDVVWHLRERARELGLGVWFHPSVDVQRAEADSLYAFSSRPGATVIQPGDLLHCDYGITYCGLNTDTQHNAYVLRPGETEAPDYLREAFMQGRRVMDILTDNFQDGATGNELLARTLVQGQEEGLRPTVYTHPIGYHGHAAGPTIGLWDQQGGVPGSGDYPLYPNTAYSIELNTRVELADWGKDIRMMMEEDGFWDGEQFRYIDGRQEELYLIAPQPDPTRFEAEIQAFERADSVDAPAPGAILFTGSSSVRFWNTLAEDFPDHQVLNRGFGGSEFSDLQYYADRVVYPYRPSVVFVYEGDNDINAGDTPAQVLAQARMLRDSIAAHLGADTPVVFISPKPSVARWHLRAAYEEANALLEAYANTTDHTYFADVWTPALKENGEVRDDIFVADDLHMNAVGYAIWREVIGGWVERLAP